MQKRKVAKFNESLKRIHLADAISRDEFRRRGTGQKRELTFVASGLHRMHCEGCSSGYAFFIGMLTREKV